MSGGGFSFYFQTPWYQGFEVIFYHDRHPGLYLDLYKCARCRDLAVSYFCNLYSRHGRGYPDISAQALDYQYIIDGEMFYMSGTICSVSVRLSLLLLPLLYLAHSQAHS